MTRRTDLSRPFPHLLAQRDADLADSHSIRQKLPDFEEGLFPDFEGE